MFSTVSVLALWAAAAVAQSHSSPFDFPEYPPPGTPDPNATLANFEGPRPYGIATDPALVNVSVHYDTGYYGPQIELIHAYYNYWPTGVGAASDGSVFTCFPRGNETYTLALLNSPTTEVAWPNEEWNTPESFVNTSNPGYSIATSKLLFVQSVVVDGLDRVWALDTGRPRVNGTTLLATVPGGPKLVGFYLNGTNFVTYTFPSDVVYTDSSLNDVRFDLRGTGYAYITDSSPQRPGIVVIDLATGESWRHLDGYAAVIVDPNFLPVYNGVPLYDHPDIQPNAVTNFNAFAVDGIALSADGEYLYVSPLADRHFWRVPTTYLKVQPSSENPYAALLARQAVQEMGEAGSHADGLETDAAGYIYSGAPEHNAVYRFNNNTGIMEPFVRNPAIQWPDTLSVVTLQSGENYLYFTSNQLWLSPDYQNGTDLRTKPYAMFRVALEAEKAPQTE
ncbi:major royal jelly protein-domain-containing protein [Sparassis latifolia]